MASKWLLLLTARSFCGCPYNHLDLQKVPKIMAQYPKIESRGSLGSIILAILEVQEEPYDLGSI